MAKTITTSNQLVLEELGWEHFNGLSELLASPKVQQYFEKTLDKEESQLFLERSMSRQESHGYSFWAVIRKSDKKFLGICGLLAQDVDGVRELEVAYRIHDKYWNKGYASEAAHACMKYAEHSLKASSVISCILPANKASERVAVKNGLKREKRTQFHGYEVFVYRKKF